MNERDNELLDMLAEECAEVIQAIMKIKRHGIESHNPDSVLFSTNRTDLKEELTQVLAVAAQVEKYVVGDRGPFDIDAAWQKKLRYTHFQESE